MACMNKQDGRKSRSYPSYFILQNRTGKPRIDLPLMPRCRRETNLNRRIARLYKDVDAHGELHAPEIRSQRCELTRKSTSQCNADTGFPRLSPASTAYRPDHQPANRPSTPLVRCCCC